MRQEASHALPLLGPHAGPLKAALADREAFLREMRRREGRLRGRYRASIYEMNLEDLLASWVDAQSANFLSRNGKLRRVRVQVALHTEGEVPDDLGPEITALTEIAKLQRAGCSADAALVAFGKPWTDPEETSAHLDRALEWTRHALQLEELIGPMLLGAEGVGGRFAALIAPAGPLANGSFGREVFGRFAAAWQNATVTIAELNRLAGVGDTDLPIARGPGWSSSNIEVALRWRASLGKSRAWCACQCAKGEAQNAGLSPIIEAFEKGLVGPNVVEQLFETAYARWWSNRVVSDDPVLRRFLPERHEDAIARFRLLDAQVTEVSKRIIRSRLGNGIPSPTTFGADPEWGTLASQMVKKRDHMPLRQLFGRLPTALTKLTPCVMMSPLSIAQYLPPENEPFDLVIFDEASQISPWDAIGAVARGKQVVVVGDPEQLPPTNVGDRGVDDIEDGSDVVDQESILDECLAANIPKRALRWHYRSRHESLIAFSNNRYYGGRLVTFPSPVTQDRAVRLVHVPDGVYERGSSNRVNRPEARAVVAEVVRRLKEPSFTTDRRSLGIVTFNADQQRLIEDLLDEQRRAHPDLEMFFDKERCSEPVFVKNLENVQGDERDLIIFSVSVGPDAAGRVSATVSSLNKEGGHRRLNVAITRARRELVVFASIRPEQIDLGRTGSRGVRDFKHFLEFADRGVRALAEASAPTDREVESPFEEAVLAALVARSWVVHPQVGVSGFRIDLGVVHPDDPGRYLAGVECDGATYHRSATARDRDRLREMVLTGLGWRIRRVWSTEWWSDAATAMDKLDALLRADLDEDRAKFRKAREAEQPVEHGSPGLGASRQHVGDIVVGADGTEPDQTADDNVTTLPLQGPASLADAEASRHQYAAAVLPTFAPVAAAVEGFPKVAPYRRADASQCGKALNPNQFYDPVYQPILAAAVAHIIAVEAPIYEDVLIQRIARAHGFNRTGSRIAQAVADVVGPAHARTEDDERLILWPEGATPLPIVPFRRSEAGTRSHADVPIAELAGLVRELTDRAPDQDVVRLLATELGLSRLEATTRLRLERAVAVASVNKQVMAQ
jgi:hypothetical protein